MPVEPRQLADGAPGFISLLDLPDHNPDHDDESDPDDSFDGEGSISIEKELHLLRRGGVALLREYTLAAKVGVERTLRLEVAQSTARLKRFSSNPHPSHAQPTGTALLDEVCAFLDGSIQDNQLRAAAGKALANACALEVKNQEIAALQRDVKKAAAEVEKSRGEQTKLEDQVRALSAALASRPTETPQSLASAACPDGSAVRAPSAPQQQLRQLSDGAHGQSIDLDADPRTLIEQIAATRLPMKGSHELRATLGRALTKLSGDIYDSANHFLHEVVQNCDDCSYDASVVPSLRIVVRPKSVSMLWNERGFTPKDIVALCDLGRSTKGSGSIGKKGVGFKSVFMVTDRPLILSNDFSFCFDLEANGPVGSLLPIWLERDTILRQLPPDWAAEIAGGLRCTALHLPLKQSCVAPTIRLEPATLLFLRRLRCIEVRDQTIALHYRHRVLSIESAPGPDSTTAVESAAESGPQFGHRKAQPPSVVIVREATEGGVQDAHFWVHRSGALTPLSLTLAFPVSLRRDTEVDDVRGHLGSQPLFCFLPICNVGLPFLLHADGFELTTSRQSIRTDSVMNSNILAAIPAAFESAIAAVPALHDIWIRYVPDDAALSTDLWRNVCRGVRDRMARGSMFRGESGALRQASDLLLRPRGWTLPVTNHDLQTALGIEFAADTSLSPLLASFGVRSFSIDTLLDVIAAEALDPILRTSPAQVYAAFQQLGGYDGGLDEENRTHRIWQAAMFPVVSRSGVEKTAEIQDDSHHDRGRPTLVALVDAHVFRSVPSELDVLDHTAFRVLASTTTTTGRDPAVAGLADQFLDTLGVHTASIDAIASCIINHHRAGASTSSIASVFSHLRFVQLFYERIDPTLRQTLCASVLVPTRDDALLHAKEVHVPTFLGLACDGCCTTDHGQQPATIESTRMLSFAKSREQVNDTTIHIQSHVGISATNETSVNYVISKVPSDKASGAVASFSPRRGKIRMDYGIDVVDTPRRHRNPRETGGVELGFGIDSTSCDSFGQDLYSFCIGDNGFQYNSDIEPLYEDPLQTVPLSLESGCTISTCLDLESLTVAFCKNGDSLFSKSGDVTFQLPMQVFADTVLVPYVKLQYGTVTASFSTRIKSIWMDTQRYHTLGHWNTMSSLSAAWKSPNLAAIPQVETSTAEMQAASAANWEFFLLRLGCQPHHRVCNRRSFWASLLEGGELGDCAVCMSPLLGLKKAVRVPACRHVFHPQCIQRWLTTSRTCPVCRGTAFSHQLETPEPDAKSHVFSTLLLAAVKALASGGGFRGYNRAATQTTFQLYLEDTFSRELLKNLPVATTRGPRRLQETFFRLPYIRFGGSALPYVMDGAVVVESCRTELDVLGIAHELSVGGMLACLTELKAVLSPKRQTVAFSSDHSAVADDVDVMAECYGQLWARLVTASPDARLVVQNQFERNKLIMLTDYSFVAPSKAVWDFSPAMNGIIDRHSLRPMYGSLKGFFVTGLDVSRTLSFTDALGALVTLHNRLGHTGRIDTGTVLCGVYTDADAATELLAAIEHALSDSVTAITEATATLTQHKAAMIPIPLPTAPRSARGTRDSLVLRDSVRTRFLERGDAASSHTTHFARAFVEPSDMLRRVAPTFLELLKRTQLVGDLSASVLTELPQVHGPTFSLSWWTSAVAEFFALHQFSAVDTTTNADGTGTTALSIAVARICVFVAKRISVQLKLLVQDFPPVDAIEDRYCHGTATGLIYCLDGSFDAKDRARAVAAGVVEYLVQSLALPDKTAQDDLDSALCDFLHERNITEQRERRGDRDGETSIQPRNPPGNLPGGQISPFNDPAAVPTAQSSTDLAPWSSISAPSQEGEGPLQCPHCGLAIDNSASEPEKVYASLQDS